MTITDDMVQPPPDVADETVQALVKGVISVDERMINLLRLDDLAPRRIADAA
jgi:purine-binding chemotaxis protein CheW